MKTSKNIGVIEKTSTKTTYEEMRIEWRLPDFSTLIETKDCFDSPAFSFSDFSWILRLNPNSGLEFMSLYIQTDASINRECMLEYKFALKKSDGSIHQLRNGVIEGNSEFNRNGLSLIEKSKILEEKSELITENVLTIVCIVKYELAHSIQPTTSDKRKTMELISLEKLSEDFKDLCLDQESCDTTLNVKDKEFKAHRAVLIARSSVFAATFRHDTLEKKTGIVTISDCEPDSFRVFLKYIYSGKVEELSVCTAISLYYTSNKYDVQELKPVCIEYLMQELIVENFCEIAVFADQYEEMALLSAVQDFFIKNMDKIFLTSEWQRFLKKENRLANRFLIAMSSKVKLTDETTGSSHSSVFSAVEQGGNTTSQFDAKILDNTSSTNSPSAISKASNPELSSESKNTNSVLGTIASNFVLGDKNEKPSVPFGSSVMPVFGNSPVKPASDGLDRTVSTYEFNFGTSSSAQFQGGTEFINSDKKRSATTDSGFSFGISSASETNASSFPENFNMNARPTFSFGAAPFTFPFLDTVAAKPASAVNPGSRKIRRAVRNIRKD